LSLTINVRFGTPRLKLAREKTENRIMAQLVVIVHVLITERNAMNTLRTERFQPVLELILIASVGEAGCDLPGQADPAIGLAQQERSGIGGDGAAIERSCHLASPQGFKRELFGITLCRHRLQLLMQVKCLL
jgi:hypothetical protein